MVEVEEEGVSETPVIAASSDAAPSSVSRGKREESRAIARPSWRETTMVPKAAMAAAPMGRTRSSTAEECFAHSESARYEGRCCEDEEDRKEEGDCQVDPGPASQRARS